MRKILMIGLFLALTSPLCAQDIVIMEPIPDVMKWKLDTIVFLTKTKQCRVTYEKVDMNDNVISKKRVKFEDEADDPNTPEDETKTE